MPVCPRRKREARTVVWWVSCLLEEVEKPGARVRILASASRRALSRLSFSVSAVRLSYSISAY